MAEHEVAGGSYFTIPFPRVPELALVGRTRFARAYHGLAEHDHGTSLEVLSIGTGRQTFCVGDDEHTIRGGECIIFPAGVAHSTGGRPQGKAELRWIQIDLGSRKPFFGSRGHEALRDALALLRVQVARFGGDMWDTLSRLYDLVSEEPRPTRDSHAAALSLLFCHRLLESARASADARTGSLIAPALELMRARMRLHGVRIHHRVHTRSGHAAGGAFPADEARARRGPAPRHDAKRHGHRPRARLLVDAVLRDRVQATQSRDADAVARLGPVVARLVRPDGPPYDVPRHPCAARPQSRPGVARE